MQTGMLVRPGNRPADPGPHLAYSTFSELLPSRAKWWAVRDSNSGPAD
jgi:hypothetical protein